jgi:phosphoserine aminotransferase
MRPNNFNAGPAVMPIEVLEEARAELLDTAGTGHSVLEWSHRSKAYDEVRWDAERRLRRLMGLPERDPWRVLFLQGGASLQFAMLPMNLATPERPGQYVNTGVWSKKALEEAVRLGRGVELWSGKPTGFDRIPEPGAWRAREPAAYVHVTTNNTIYGTQWHELPDTGGTPLVLDASSDILSRPMPYARSVLVYAGAQKNLGPAGLTIVALHTDTLARPAPGIPAILDYRVHAEADGIYNTHPTFAVWLMAKTLAWIERSGGLAAIAARNEEKAALLYAEIDRSGFYRGHAQPGSRSRMNVTFRIAKTELEDKFVKEADAAALLGLKGHRSVGGLRASLYNALPLESVRALVEFMRDFERRHG